MRKILFNSSLHLPLARSARSWSDMSAVPEGGLRLLLYKTIPNSKWRGHLCVSLPKVLFLQGMSTRILDSCERRKREKDIGNILQISSSAFQKALNRKNRRRQSRERTVHGFKVLGLRTYLLHVQSQKRDPSGKGCLFAQNHPTCLLFCPILALLHLDFLEIFWKSRRKKIWNFLRNALTSRNCLGFPAFPAKLLGTVDKNYVFVSNIPENFNRKNPKNVANL